MNPTILILEDDSVQSDMLEEYIESYSPALTTHTVTSLSEALNAVKKYNNFEAFFLDISLDETATNTDGLELALYLSSQDNTKHIPIIFVTSYPEHTYKAINDLHCFGYILKPYTKVNVHKQLSDIFSNHFNESYISVRTLDGIYIKLDQDEIYYIESQGRYMYFHTSHGEIKSRQYRLKELISILTKDFEQCHKSYIVNKKYIESIFPSERLIKIKKINDTIPFSKDYKYL